MPNNIIQRVLDWGRATESQDTVDKTGVFGPKDVEALRRLLRSEYQQQTPGVTGSWRKGYEMSIGQERIGVTNGHGPSFKVYYRKCNPFRPNPMLYGGPSVPVRPFNINDPIPPEVTAAVERAQSRWQPLQEDVGLAGPAEIHHAPILAGQRIAFGKEQ